MEKVKFINGEEKLRSFEQKLQNLKYAVNFPDETPAKILRRGTLSCSQEAACRFVLLLPDDVRTVN